MIAEKHLKGLECLLTIVKFRAKNSGEINMEARALDGDLKF